MTARRLAACALVATLALAACGSDDDGAQPAADSGPKRVVALDFPSADAVLALGVTPIAIGKVSYVPGGVQEWTKAALGRRKVKILDDPETQVPLEDIAALRPDLIVASHTYNLSPARAKFARLAPLVTWKRGPGVDTWQETTLRVGKALGREAKARELVRDTEARIAQARADHPAFAGKTVTVFNYAQGSAWAISSPDDFSIRFLSTLGFELAPAIERRRGKDGRLQVSTERLRLLDADVVLGTSSESRAGLDALARSPLFRRVDAVRRGAYSSLDIGPATSIAFPSALSVNYALRELVPLLDRLTAQ